MLANTASLISPISTLITLFTTERSAVLFRVDVSSATHFCLNASEHRLSTGSRFSANSLCTASSTTGTRGAAGSRIWASCPLISPWRRVGTFRQASVKQDATMSV